MKHSNISQKLRTIYTRQWSRLLGIGLILIGGGLGYFALHSIDTASTIEAKQEKKSLEMGKVTLSVHDLSTVSAFYQEKLGLEPLSIQSGSITLGKEKWEILELTERVTYQQPTSKDAWLYHVAIVYSSRSALAKQLVHILTLAPEYYQGSADHTATEAFYFSDPEGNGIELYYDKPRTDWIYENGKPIMGSQYIDVRSYIQQHIGTLGTPSAKVGHVHLKIGNIEEAKRFYIDTLGFDEIRERDGALFVSKDGYHHHLGMNTWESNGAKKREENTLGLEQFEIVYFDPALYNSIYNRLMSQSRILESGENFLITEDPWGNRIKLSNKQ